MNEKYFLEKIGINYTEECLSILTPRQRDVVLLRTGVKTGEVLTLQEIADGCGYTRERIRQIYDKAKKILKRGYRERKYKPSYYKKHQKIILEKKLLLSLWSKLVKFSFIFFEFYDLYLKAVEKLENLPSGSPNELKIEMYYIERLRAMKYYSVKDLVYERYSDSWLLDPALYRNKQKINDAVFDFLSSL